eukprot:4235016-Pyramimonas_sp.AAC.1
MGEDPFIFGHFQPRRLVKSAVAACQMVGVTRLGEASSAGEERLLCARHTASIAGSTGRRERTRSPSRSPRARGRM